jgi:hypothetical protein
LRGRVARRAPTSRSSWTTFLKGRIDPGRVFDFETDLDAIVEAYACRTRRAVKSLVRVERV